MQSKSVDITNQVSFTKGNTGNSTTSTENGANIVKPTGNVFDDMIKSTDGKLAGLKAQNAKTARLMQEQLEDSTELKTPLQIVNLLNIKPDMQVVEFGSGAGDFVFAVAKRLQTGDVYGVDVQKELLVKMLRQAKELNLGNIKAVWGDVENPSGSKLPDLSFDMVLVPNMLFQAEDKQAVILEAYRILKKGGKMVIIDWLSSSGPLGPRADQILDREFVIDMAMDTGFIFSNEMRPDEYHFLLEFNKK